MVWNNADGLKVRFPGDYRRRTANYARHGKTYGLTKELEYDFQLSRIPDGTVAFTSDPGNTGTNTGFYLGDPCLPAGARVTKVVLVMTEAAAGGTSITFGTFQKSGTAIDADGLITATEGVIANMNSVGESILGNGAQVVYTSNTGVSIGSVPAYVAITTAGTFTAGKGRIQIEYTTAPTTLP